MGNKRKPRRSRDHSQLAANIRAMQGMEIPGGCDDCNAYQTVATDSRHENAHHLTVHHDDTCPFLARYEGRA